MFSWRNFYGSMSVAGALCAVLATVPAIGLAQDGDKAATAIRGFVTNFGGDTISVIDPEQGQLITHIKTGAKPHGVAISPDGSAVYVSNEGSGTLVTIDPVSNAVVHTLQIGNEPNQIAVSADGRYVFATLHGDDTLAVVDTIQQRVVKVVAVGRAPHIVKRSPDGKSIFVTVEGDMKIREISVTTWEIIQDTFVRAFPRVFAISDQRTLYLTMRWLNGALVIDFDRGEVVDRIALGEPEFAAEGADAHGLAITPNGQELWLSTQTTNDVTVLSLPDHQVIDRIDVGQNPNWLEFTPDGNLALVSNTGSGDVSIIDVDQRQVVRTVGVGPLPKRLAVGYVKIGDRWRYEATQP